MPDKWRNIAGFYWRKEFVHNGVPVYAEISLELARNEKDAEDLFLGFRKTAFPEIHRGFKDSCSYDLEIGEQQFKVTCFRNRSESGVLTSCGIRICPQTQKSPA